MVVLRAADDSPGARVPQAHHGAGVFGRLGREKLAGCGVCGECLPFPFFPGNHQKMETIWNLSRNHLVTFPILSRDPDLSTKPPTNRGSWFLRRERWLRRMEKESTPRVQVLLSARWCFRFLVSRSSNPKTVSGCLSFPCQTALKTRPAKRVPTP